MAQSFSGSDSMIYCKDVYAAVDELEDDISLKDDECDEVESEIYDKKTEIEDFQTEQAELPTSNDDDIEELEMKIGGAEEELRSLESKLADLNDDLEEMREELKPIKELANDIDSYAGGEDSLISDDYFEDYARQLASDIGAVSEEWPNGYIDWEAAADALKIDYNCIEFECTDFWVRA